MIGREAGRAVGWGLVASRLVGRWEGDAKGALIGCSKLTLPLAPWPARLLSWCWATCCSAARVSLPWEPPAPVAAWVGRPGPARAGAGLTVTEAGGPGPAGSEGAARFESPGRRRSRVTAVRPAAHSPRRSRGAGGPQPGVGRRRSPRARADGSAASHPAATADAVFYQHRILTLADSSEQADWGRERLHSSWVRI